MYHSDHPKGVEVFTHKVDHFKTLGWSLKKPARPKKDVTDGES